MTDTDARLWHPWLRINRVRRVDNPEVTMIRTWAAHERVSVRRAT